LARLFSEGASYRMSPYAEPARGLAAIAQLWERERQGANEAFAMSHEVVAIDGDAAVVRVEVEYGEPRPAEYRDLWIVKLDADGRCREFEEWPFWPGQSIDPEGGQR
jgi:SnoaL-like protein